jgi:hypothetical protein
LVPVITAAGTCLTKVTVPLSALAFPNQYRTQVGLTLADFWYALYYRDQRYLDFACCLMAATTANSFGDPWLTSDFIALTFGMDNVTLSCNQANAAFVAKPTNFCSTGPNLAYETGVKALAQVPGASAYSGVARTLTRYVNSAVVDPLTCSSTNCSGRGECNLFGSCSCYSGYWGSNCQYSKT